MILAIIQARMGSTRLPNKVMRKVLNKPVIQYLLERVSKSQKIDKIILATSTDCKDDILAEYVRSLGYEVFRGSQNDVLERYYKAFKQFSDHKNVTGIVRLTGDCPLLDPTLIDKVITQYIQYNADHISLSEKYAEGLDTEVFKPQLLIDAHQNAKTLPEREHVMLYISNNKAKYNIKKVENNNDDSKYRITIDEIEDFMVFENIILNFAKNGLETNIDNIKNYLNQNKDILLLNSKIVRNEGLKISLEDEKKANNGI